MRVHKSQIRGPSVHCTPETGIISCILTRPSVHCTHEIQNSLKNYKFFKKTNFYSKMPMLPLPSAQPQPPDPSTHDLKCPNSSLQIFSLVCCLVCNENVDPFAYYVWSLGTTRKVSKRRIRIYCLLFIQRVN